ncbi:tissue-type plasminogen activator-like [Penaeus monodon]|uniref:tissue-type plasminogen activator-like n=1 Tax=Penaeus monodon TaxID=6687 RepID=UPI0018A73601|nr:tissue-type plasminogen activator-like [Penaeus monodon]
MLINLPLSQYTTSVPHRLSLIVLPCVKLQQEFGIAKVWIHEQYEDTHFQDNDIALVRIERKWGRGFRFNKRVRPVCLPSADASYEELGDCSVSGWGRTIHNYILAGKSKTFIFYKADPGLNEIIRSSASFCVLESQLRKSKDIIP